MELSAYLNRIGFDGNPRPDQACLRAVHRRHLSSIAYENLDVQLGRPLDLDPERIFAKIVRGDRGGWCYEMNGLLGWALSQIGFDVTRMTGGVGRAEVGDDAFGNHLVLQVMLDEPHIADVGIGTGMMEAVPLREGPFSQDGRQFAFEPLGNDEWRFHNSDGALPGSFDFRHGIADEALLARTCQNLQLCYRLGETGTHILLGRTLMKTGTHETRTLNSADELIDVLERVFRIRDPDAGDLWPRVAARHAELFGDAAAEGKSV
jgi:N-hydroxyarylamine O-acetyltransferase